MPKPFSKKNSSGTIQPIAGRIKGFIAFPRVLAYYNSAVHRFNHYIQRTPQKQQVNRSCLIVMYTGISLADTKQKNELQWTTEDNRKKKFLKALKTLTLFYSQ